MAGPALNGSAVSGALSAWRRAASVIAPWAVRAARARFIDSRSIASRFSGESSRGPSPCMKPASAIGGEGGADRTLGWGADSVWTLGLEAASGFDFACDEGLAAGFFLVLVAAVWSVMAVGPYAE